MIADAMARAHRGTLVRITLDDRHEQAAELLRKVPGVAKVALASAEGRTRLEVTLDPVAFSAAIGYSF